MRGYGIGRVTFLAVEIVVSLNGGTGFVSGALSGYESYISSFIGRAFSSTKYCGRPLRSVSVV